MRFCPQYKNIPSTVIKCPEGAKEVVKRLVSEEGRINSATKLAELHELKDHVFRARVDRPPWDLSSIVETKVLRSRAAGIVDQQQRVGTADVQDADNSADDSNGSGSDSDHDDNRAHPGNSSQSQGEVEPSRTSAEDDGRENPKQTDTANNKAPIPSTQLSYEVGQFVVVNVDDKDEDDSKSSGVSHAASTFWVARITGLVKKKTEHFVRQLRVHWFDIDEDKKEEDRVSPLDEQYYPSYRALEKRRKVSSLSSKSRSAPVSVPNTDTIDTDTVRMTFDTLKKDHTLPVSVKKELASSN